MVIDVSKAESLLKLKSPYTSGEVNSAYEKALTRAKSESWLSIEKRDQLGKVLMELGEAKKICVQNSSSGNSQTQSKKPVHKKTQPLDNIFVWIINLLVKIYAKFKVIRTKLIQFKYKSINILSIIKLQFRSWKLSTRKLYHYFSMKRIISLLTMCLISFLLVSYPYQIWEVISTLSNMIIPNIGQDSYNSDEGNSKTKNDTDDNSLVSLKIFTYPWCDVIINHNNIQVFNVTAPTHRNIIIKAGIYEFVFIKDKEVVLTKIITLEKDVNYKIYVRLKTNDITIFEEHRSE